MRVALLVLAALAASLAVFASTAAARGAGCSDSGDVCVGVFKEGSTIVLSITTAAKYFNRYRLCVRGPKSRVCKSFPIHKKGDHYESMVRWHKNFPNQGKGVYRVTWEHSAETLTFKR